MEEDANQTDIAEIAIQKFDPMQSEVDRRLLYEITGHRLFEDEFLDSESDSDNSSDDEDEKQVINLLNHSSPSKPVKNEPLLG